MTRISARKRLLAVALTLVLGSGLAACGSDDPADKVPPDPVKATLVLDYLPNGVHAGVYRALAAGHYEREGIDLRVITPTSTADTLRLIGAGKADFGFADGIDIATQIDEGRAAKGIMAVTQRPSGGLITLVEEGIETPKDLAGKTVGVTGVPSDTAVFETIVRDGGADPRDSKVVTIGFNGVQALQAGRISAFTGYIPADGTAIEFSGKPTRSFAFDDFGGPSYPGLVAFSTESHIAENPELMSGFVKATVEGYRDALEDPEAAVADLVAVDESLDPGLALDTFTAYEPLIGPADGVGRFRDGDLEDLSRFMTEEKLIGEPIAPERFGTNEFQPE